MAFFQEIKEKLESALVDLSTVEHALILEDSDGCIYRFQQTEGDSLAYVSEAHIDEVYYTLFNEAFSASVEARTSITRFIIDCLTSK